MILNYSLYQIAALFFIYAFLGWCIEVIYCGLSEGHFINRGFLNGPVCPIYGVGGVLVVLCLTPISGNIWALFIGSAILTSILELVTGFALDKIFHARWWDYTDVPFNLGGYICLKYSIYWGLVCIALMRGIHPTIMKLISIVPSGVGIIILCVLSAVFIADLVITVVAITKLTKRMELMDDVARRIRAVSDKIGEGVYDGAVKVKGKSEEILNSDEAKEWLEKGDAIKDELKEKYEKEMAELKEKYARMQKPRYLQRRIIKAFPKLKFHNHNEQLEKLKERFWGKRNNKEERIESK